MEKMKEWFFRSGTQRPKRGMLLPVRCTNTRKKRIDSPKKHDMKYFCCLRSNDGDGRMEIQGLSDLFEVVQSTGTKGSGQFSCWPRGQRHRRRQQKINERRCSEKLFN
ncbi:hypothetical protein AVEN_117325-1 [Araneus ventricosus]|uniref:Uncharacterized protein n=1 Tax=Araneus ventricosus TaxID=182803 RepID=A0A4Y2TAR5_ARAVE|nr:hypothetical protein AVEN_117325-1 [Araneus ventricosus]